MRKFKIFFLFLMSFELFAQSLRKDSEIEIKLDTEEIDKKSRQPENIYNRRLEEIFSNPSVVSGLNSGADLINQSVDALMESVFYRLLDNERTFAISDLTKITFGLDRQLFSTAFGGYLVADRMRINPNYSVSVYKVGAFPIIFGLDGFYEVGEIYLSSESKRALENEKLPFWKKSLNNWFGLLPFLTRILPPSFNPLELYNPWRELNAPISFPLDHNSFAKMERGTIRTFAMRGTISFSMPIEEGISQLVRDQILTETGLIISLPISVYTYGEIRVNILKKDEKTAWVSLTRSRNRAGALRGNIGNRYFVGQGILAFLHGNPVLSSFAKSWKGFLIPFNPVIFDYTHSLGVSDQEVYEIKMNHPGGQQAYKMAAKGDFFFMQDTLGKLPKDEQKKSKEKMGYSFLLKKIDHEIEKKYARGNNFFVIKRQNERSNRLVESEIKTANETKFELENKVDYSTTYVSTLSGVEEVKLFLETVAPVKRLDKKESGNKSWTDHRYESANPKNPFKMLAQFSLQDRFTDVDDFERYKKIIENILVISLADLPTFPRKDIEGLKKANELRHFSNPSQEHLILHQIPMPLGKFFALSTIEFSAKQIQEAAMLDRKTILAAVEDVFKDIYGKPIYKTGVFDGSEEALYFIGSPFRLLNLRPLQLEIPDAVKSFVESLEDVKQFRTIDERIEQLSEIFRSEYPLEVLGALIRLVGTEKVKRKLVFQTSARGNLSEELRRTYESIDGQSFQVLKSSDYKDDDEEEADYKVILKSFFPTDQRAFSGVSIKKIIFKSSPVEEKVFVKNKSKRKNKKSKTQEILNSENLRSDLELTIDVESEKEAAKYKTYIRIEEAGRLLVGKFRIVDQIIELPAKDLSENNVRLNMFLSGPRSLINSFYWDKIIQNQGKFHIYVSVSPDGRMWSQEKSFGVEIRSGKIFKTID